jgi:uncharacterized radical SAM superfamily Fe-S cluster-containing enzyme
MSEILEKKEDELISKTVSICPICTFVDKKEMNWIKAEYINRKEQVWLSTK